MLSEQGKISSRFYKSRLNDLKKVSKFNLQKRVKTRKINTKLKTKTFHLKQEIIIFSQNIGKLYLCFKLQRCQNCPF